MMPPTTNMQTRSLEILATAYPCFQYICVAAIHLLLIVQHPVAYGVCVNMALVLVYSIWGERKARSLLAQRRAINNQPPSYRLR